MAILGLDGKPIPKASKVRPGRITYRRDGASRTGSLSNWRPQRNYFEDQAEREREDIIDRSINLVNDDPNAAGIIETFATTIIGPGLWPNPTISAKRLGIDSAIAKELKQAMRQIYWGWAPTADAAYGRMTDGEIQHLKARCLFGFGESLELVHMSEDPLRPYMLCSQVINPLRLRTPTDLKNGKRDIREGVEIGKFGEPVAYWIKKLNRTGSNLGDSSKNFVRISARMGHRWLVLHDFIAKEPEQFRGYPVFSAMIRTFRDFSDLWGGELTSQVVTAALSVFVGSDNPDQIADALMAGVDEGFDEEERKQVMVPGEIWYGNPGEEPKMLSPDRPGNNFEPFTRLMKKTISNPTGIPFQALLKDFDGLSFAGFRSVMLEAWRVYDYHRKRLSQRDPQRKYAMLMEEAFLKGHLPISDFYENMNAFTRAEWIGPPKGDIEPFKMIQADIAKRNAGVKTTERIILEDNGAAGFEETTDQIEGENIVLKEKGIVVEDNSTAEAGTKMDKDEKDDE